MNFYALVYFLKSHSEAIDELRKKYDPMVDIIKPHVTIVFPISENEITEDVLIEHIQNQVKNFRSFLLQFSGLKCSWDDYLFLVTKDGTKNMEKMHDDIYKGILAPFLRHDISFSPHVTLGVFQQKQEQYIRAEKEAKQQNFSFTETIDHVSLIKGNGIFQPETIQKFLLG